MKPWKKVVLAVGIVLGSLALVAGLGIGAITYFAKMISDPIPQDPQYPVVFGIRVTDNHFWISTARPCPTHAVLSVVFPGSKMATPISVTLLKPIDTLDLTDPGPDVTVQQYMAQGFLWSDEGTRVEITTQFPDGSSSFFSAVNFTDLQEESADYPDQFFFGQMGWLAPDDVAARDGIDLLTVCTPRPS